MTKVWLRVGFCHKVPYCTWVKGFALGFFVILIFPFQTTWDTYIKMHYHRTSLWHIRCQKFSRMKLLWWTFPFILYSWFCVITNNIFTLHMTTVACYWNLSIYMLKIWEHSNTVEYSEIYFLTWETLKLFEYYQCRISFE